MFRISDSLQQDVKAWKMLMLRVPSYVRTCVSMVDAIGFLLCLSDRLIIILSQENKGMNSVFIKKEEKKKKNCKKKLQYFSHKRSQAEER